MHEKITETKKQLDALTAQMSQPDADFVRLAKEHKKLSAIVAKHDALEAAKKDLAAAEELGLTDDVASYKGLAGKIEAELDELLYPRHPRDAANVIMEIRPAAGGDEAALFAATLFKMYSNYATACGFSVEVNDINETEIGGIKEVSFMVIGDGAYSKLKYESGVHRVQRVPDTETQGRIHTSTCTVAVLPESVTVDFKINPEDLRIDVYRSSGAGGQHVNKTESAVRITHLPTNMVVACQDGRSQIKNREKAMLVLQSKLADYYQSLEDAKYAKDRKQQVGTGDRSERIRTYNFPQDRVTDHRAGVSFHNLPNFVAGSIGPMVEALHQFFAASNNAR